MPYTPSMVPCATESASVVKTIFKKLNIPELKKLLTECAFSDTLRPLAEQMLKAILEQHPFRQRPQIIHLCGIPCSGKSTYAQWLQQNAYPDHYVLSFDHIMLQLPGYKADYAAVGSKQAFANWELRARGLGYYFLRALLYAKRSIIFDHSAANESHIPLLKQIRAVPYKVELHYTPCNTATAYARVKKREKQEQRHTPTRYITERAALLRRLLPIYQKVVDRYVEIEQKIHK